MYISARHKFHVKQNALNRNERVILNKNYYLRNEALLPFLTKSSYGFMLLFFKIKFKTFFCFERW